ncbi:MAG TPA: response regulator [Humisphaera sp.]
MADILIVDDSAVMCDLMAGLLARHGHRPTCATDSQKAWAALERATPDLVLLDLVMPKPGGLQLLKMLRSLPEFQRLPVIILTGSLSRQDLADARAIGAQGYVLKQAGMTETVLAAVDRVLAARAASPLPTPSMAAAMS